MRFVIVLVVLFFCASSASPATRDRALRLARAIGGFAGYSPSGARKIDYDFTDKPGHETYDGFITVQLMSNAHAVFDLSVDDRTGRVYDFTRCLSFRYRTIFRNDESSDLEQREIDAKAMYDNGCLRYRVLVFRGDEARNLPLIEAAP